MDHTLSSPHRGGRRVRGLIRRWLVPPSTACLVSPAMAAPTLIASAFAVSLLLVVLCQPQVATARYVQSDPNNANCESVPNVGPIPRGCWLWNGGATSKPGGRTLVTLPPQSSRPFGRDLFRTHSCLNPFGPSTVSPYCSEGCVTGTSGTVSELNDLIDSEPGSVMCVVD
jgi:hypothetical protein